MSSVLKRRNNNRKSPVDYRLNIILLSFLFLFILVEIRLFKIQVLSYRDYKDQAEKQYEDYRDIQAKRGSIFTKEGYILAGNQTYYLLYAEPKNIIDKNSFSHNLSSVLAELSLLREKSSPEEEGRKTYDDYYVSYYETISQEVKKDLYWIPIWHYLTPNERKIIEEKNIPYIGFEEEPKRYYPEGTLAAHILGFVGSDEKGNKVGYYGIEGRLNEDLSGRMGKIIEETDAGGTPILIGKYKKVDPIQGRDLYLTIQRPIQYIAEKMIKKGVEEYDAVSGSIIVMDPFTGDILALANFPTYSPADFSASETSSDAESRRKLFERKNSAISRTYEPGSVIKPLTVSAAMDLGLVTPETTYEDNGPAVYSGRIINNWNFKHLGTLNIVQLLQKSNNIGAAWVGHLVGSKKLHEYFSKFGMGTKTNVELEGEDSGILPNYKDWVDINTATISFGQGLSATALQVLNAFNVIANGGYLLEPKIIDRVVDGDKVIDMPTKNIRRVISKETSDTMVWVLEKAVEGGEGKAFSLKDYRISGKTGTAEVPDEKGGYSSTRTNATFAGFMTDTKKFSMIVVLQEPRTSTYASETAVPLWMETATELLEYYGIPPDKETVQLEN